MIMIGTGLAALLLGAIDNRRSTKLLREEFGLHHLTAEDWREIDAAFSGNADPLVGESAGADYEALFRRIVNLAPPPIGGSGLATAGAARR